MKYNLTKYKRQYKSAYNGFKLGPSYIQLTLDGFSQLQDVGEPRIELFYDIENLVIGLKPTKNLNGFALNPSIHCRMLKEMPWGRYHFKEILEDGSYIYKYVEE